MSTLTEARKEAATFNLEFGKFTTEKDSQGFYELYEDGFLVAEGWAESATAMKVDYIEDKIYNLGR